MNKSYLLVIVAAVFWATMGLFAKYLTEFGLSSVQIGMFRALFACLFMLVFILCKDKKLFKIRLRDIWMFLGTGVVSFFLFNIFYFLAVQEIGVGTASVLLYTYPILVTLMSCVLFREKLTARKVISLVLAVGGCAFASGLASGNAGSVSVLGVTVALCSSLAFALYSIFSTFALRKYSSYTVTFYTFLFGTAASCAAGDPVGSFRAIATPAGIALAVALGVIAAALPYLLYTLALTRVKASNASVIATLEPVVASAFGILFFREKADIFTVLGVVLVVSAAVLLNLPEKNDKSVT